MLIISTRHKAESPKATDPQDHLRLPFSKYEEAGIDGTLETKPLFCSIEESALSIPMKVTKIYEDWPESGSRTMDRN